MKIFQNNLFIKSTTFCLLVSFFLSNTLVVFAQEAQAGLNTETITKNIDSVLVKENKDEEIKIEPGSIVRDQQDFSVRPDAEIEKILQNPAQEKLNNEKPVNEKSVEGSTADVLKDGVAKSDVIEGAVAERSVTGPTGSYGPGDTIKVPSIPKAEGNTGAMSYSYKIEVPEGRSGLTPNINLQYNSQLEENQNWNGYGFSKFIAYIKINNINGVPTMYSDNNYTSSEFGEMANVSGNTYTAKKSTVFKPEIIKDGSTWTYTDKSGTKYTYGSDHDSRIQNPSDLSKIYQWFLSDVTDTNGNNIHYTYQKDADYVYPVNIRYTNNLTAGSQGAYEVRFNLESRPDTMESYQPGFKIVNNKRIREVTVYQNGNKIKSYTLRYATGVNGLRSLFAGITETGYSSAGAATQLPEVTFSYSQASTTPVSITLQDDFDRVADINGDGLNDFILSRAFYYNNNSYPRKITYINNGDNTFTQNNILIGTYSMGNEPYSEIPFYLSEYNQYFGGAIQNQNYFVEEDGDGYVDLLHYFQSYKGLPFSGAQQATSSLFWNFDSSINIPSNSRIETINLNGARKPYILVRPNVYDVSQSIVDGSIVYFDINGDGLDDKIQVSSYFSNYSNGVIFKKNIWVNNGNDFTLLTEAESSKYSLPTSYETANYNINTFTNFYFDYNFDGISDVVRLDGGMYMNRGIDTVLAPGYLISSSPYGASFVADLNGDGLQDVAKVVGTNGANSKTYEVVMSKMKSDLMVGMSSSLGASYNFDYAPASSYKKEDGSRANRTGYPVWTLKSQTVNDGNGNIATTTYSYEDAYVSRLPNFDNTLAGFGRVLETDPVGVKTISYYHQGNISNSTLGEYNDTPSKIGKMYRRETLSPGGQLYKVDITKWGDSNIVNGADFVYPIQSLSRLVTNGSSYTDTAIGYTYNLTNGDLTQKVEYGFVNGNNDGTFGDTGGDKYTTDYIYSVSSDGKIHMPSQIYVSNQSGGKEKETKYDYDGLKNGAGVIKGNLTRESIWTNGTNYANTSYAYNAYGLKTSKTDPNNNTTTYSYDQYNLNPSSVAQPLNMVTSYIYDYAVGKPIRVTDVNNKNYYYSYDGFGRIKEEQIPDPQTGVNVTKNLYYYTDTPNNLAVKVTNYLDGSRYVNSYKYMDGLGRVIQTKKKATHGYSAVDMVYNTDGTVQKFTVPYTDNNYTKTTRTPTSYLYTTYTYDTLKRPVTIQSGLLGATTHNYSGMSDTFTDGNGKQKKYTTDAYGNLIQVVEYLSGNQYITNYAYDYNKKLNSLTDSLGKIRNFINDGRGLQMKAEDLHAPSDNTYTAYYYTYDSNGNLIQKVTPNGKTIIYTYDGLNRILNEDDTSVPGGIDMIYEYDNCINGKMKLCRTINNWMPTIFAYDNNGNVASQGFSDDWSRYFTKNQTYNRQGGVINTKYPDNIDVTNIYSYSPGEVSGEVGAIETSIPGVGLYSLVSIERNANNQIMGLYRDGGSGYNTGIEYDPAYNYRMTRMWSQKPGNPRIQDSVYAYDAVNNITSITDDPSVSDRRIANYTYDDLYRLLQAQITFPNTSTQNYTENYTYNPIGNITTKNGVYYTYSANSGYVNPNAPIVIGSNNLTYDNNGNLIQDNFGNYTYWWRDEMLSATKGTTTYSYLYNYKKDRIIEKIDNITTKYTPFRDYTYDPINNITTKHIYIGDKLIANLTTTSTTTNIEYTITDYLGSVIKTTDRNSNILSNTNYTPYGVQSTTGSTNNTRNYIGERYDTTTNLNYLNARYYDGARGQFTQQDPVFWELGQTEDGKKALLNPQLLNSYSYGANNPITNKDPEGRTPQAVAAVIAQQMVRGAIYGAATDIAIQGAYDLHNGKMSSSDTYIQAGIIGASTGAATFGGSAYLKAGRATADIGGKVLAKEGIVLNNLEIVPSAAKKLDNLSSQFNKSGEEIINYVQQNGKAYVDNTTGNINFFANKLNQAEGYIRVTVEPTLNRIISAGQNKVRNVVNGIKNGRFTDFNK